MPSTKLWVHAVWSTKHRAPVLSRDIRPLLIRHIVSNAKLKHVIIDSINGVEDHLHLLLMLRSDQSIARVMQLVKGESSHWINDSELLPLHFLWQEEYFAVSVSEPHVGRVRKYILNQEQHHRGSSTRRPPTKITNTKLATDGLTMDFE